MDESHVNITQKLDALKGIAPNGAEYWMARDIQHILQYTKWQNFEGVIEKAVRACAESNVEPSHHIAETSKMMELGKGAHIQGKDYFLSRYACYLIAMNADPGKREVALAQTYFAIQTRRMEQEDKLSGDRRRLELRRRVRDHHKTLNQAAKEAGVERYAIFHAAGIKAMYAMRLQELKRRRNLAAKEDWLDRAGAEELAANDFRITQAEAKLKRDGVGTERDAINTHSEVGRQVRRAIERIGGAMPETLPVERHIKEVERRLAATSRKLIADGSE
jgi:DNA-damage-inducible protein D